MDQRRRARMALVALGLSITSIVGSAAAADAQGVSAALSAPQLAVAPAPDAILAAPAQSVLGAPLVRAHTALAIDRVRLEVLTGQVASVQGSLRPALPGRLIVLQGLGAHGWQTLARSRTGTLGRFTLRYVAHRTLSERTRLRFPGDPLDRAVGRPLGPLDVYRLAQASWYGGGGGLACGGQLTSSTLGVANRTLPCGTIVTLRYGARTVRVPVIDRGPFVAGREFDLTEATKRALGFADLGTVWSTR